MKNICKCCWTSFAVHLGQAVTSGKKKRKTDFHADHNLNHPCLNRNNNLVFGSVPTLSFCFFLSEPQIFSCAGQAIRLQGGFLEEERDYFLHSKG